MLFMLNMYFTAIVVVCFVLIFPGPDPTELNDKLIDKVTNASRRALSGYDVSVHTHDNDKSVPQALSESVNEESEYSIKDEEITKDVLKSKKLDDEAGLRFTLARESAHSIPVRSTKASGRSILGTSILKKHSSRSIKKEEQLGDGVKFEFIDVDDPNKEPLQKLDMDNVILNEAQKKLLFWQCVKSRQFWVLYAM